MKNNIPLCVRMPVSLACVFFFPPECFIIVMLCFWVVFFFFKKKGKWCVEALLAWTRSGAGPTALHVGCVVRIVQGVDGAHNELIYFVRMTHHQLNPWFI